MRFRQDLREMLMLQVWRAHLALQDTADVHETGGACTAPGHLQGCIYHISPNTPQNFMIFVAFCSVFVCTLDSATCHLFVLSSTVGGMECVQTVLKTRLMGA